MGSCWTLVKKFLPDRQLYTLGRVCFLLDIHWTLVKTFLPDRWKSNLGRAPPCDSTGWIAAGPWLRLFFQIGGYLV